MENAKCPTCGAPIPRSRTAPKYCSDACKPLCSVDGCVGVARKRGWCASHYAQQRHTGRAPEPFQHRWADRVPCLVCGSSSEGSPHRQFCSDACRVLHRSHDGNRPTSVACIACGVEIDLLQRTKRGQRRDSIRCPSVDHVVPRAHGGGHEPGNLQLAHLDCNMRKSDRLTAPRLLAEVGD